MYIAYRLPNFGPQIYSLSANPTDGETTSASVSSNRLASPSGFYPNINSLENPTADPTDSSTHSETRTSTDFDMPTLYYGRNTGVQKELVDII